MTPYDRLKELGLELPSPATPMANYVPFVMVNGLLYLSGQGPRRADGSLCTGKVGSEVSVEDAYQHAISHPGRTGVRHGGACSKQRGRDSGDQGTFHGKLQFWGLYRKCLYPGKHRQPGFYSIEQKKSPCYPRQLG